MGTRPQAVREGSQERGAHAAENPMPKSTSKALLAAGHRPTPATCLRGFPCTMARCPKSKAPPCQTHGELGLKQSLLKEHWNRGGRVLGGSGGAGGQGAAPAGVPALTSCAAPCRGSPGRTRCTSWPRRPGRWRTHGSPPRCPCCCPGCSSASGSRPRPFVSARWEEGSK